VRAYSASSQEARRACDLLKDWARESFLTEAQYQRMKQETVCELRRTNVFLRPVLFLFTLIIVGAAAALFFVVFRPESTMEVAGVFLLIVAMTSYAATELAVSQARLYRYGIEEALAACSVGFLCAGLQSALLSGHLSSPKPDPAGFLVPAAGTIFSLWVWHRFGLAYAFFAAMIFVLWLPGHWTFSHSAQHLIVAAFYVAGLLTVTVVRRRHRFTYLNREYSIAEALLWLGLYLTTNLQISSIDIHRQWWASAWTTTEFSRPFYWATWVLTWCLPPIVLVRGLREKDRSVIMAGATVGILTLVTNKPYLDWARHSWDPMLLGLSLIGVALFIRRWLSNGPSAIRHGFTAQRLAEKDKLWINAGATAFGLVSPSTLTPSAQTQSSDFHFRGGDFGGGGAASDF
jgi:hypothetical protein